MVKRFDEIRAAGTTRPEPDDLPEGQPDRHEHQRRREDAIDPVGPPAPTVHRVARQPSHDQPRQERAEHGHGRHLLDEAEAQARHRPRPASFRAPGVMQALPEGERGDDPEEAGPACRSRRCGRRRRPSASPARPPPPRLADPSAIPPGRGTRTPGRSSPSIRRPRPAVATGMSFIQSAEDRVSQQVQLAGQGRVEVVAVPGVGPVEKQGVGREEALETSARRSAPSPAFPTTAPRRAGWSGTRARPRSGRCRRWWGRVARRASARTSRGRQPPGLGRSDLREFGMGRQSRRQGDR